MISSCPNEPRLDWTDNEAPQMTVYGLFRREDLRALPQGEPFERNVPLDRFIEAYEIG